MHEYSAETLKSFNAFIVGHFPVPSLLQSKPRPEMASPGALGQRRPPASTQAEMRRPAQSLPVPRSTSPGPDASGLVAPLPKLPARARSSASAQPRTTLRDQGLAARYLTPRRSGWENRGTVSSGSNPRQRRLTSKVLGWRGRGWGTDPSRSHLSPYGNSERTRVSALRLRAASTS